MSDGCGGSDGCNVRDGRCETDGTCAAETRNRWNNECSYAAMEERCTTSDGSGASDEHSVMNTAQIGRAHV